jgi:hypothetical protein
MNRRASQLLLTGEVLHRHEADEHLKGPGSAVLVRRGVARSLVIACPDGCGDALTINLDRRAGPAWRIYRDRGGLSLFPSVWRENGCRSHFIVWRSQISWCDFDYDGADDSGQDPLLERRIRAVLGGTFASYVSIADDLDEVPWAVLAACRRLTETGEAKEGTGKARGTFSKP